MSTDQSIAQSESTLVGHTAALDIYSDPKHKRRTSIICTIGPKTGTPEKLLALRNAGMNVMRLNFSHGSYEFHGGLIANLRKTFETNPGPPVAIALDTKGPEIRTGMIVENDGNADLKKGNSIKLTSDKEWFEKGTSECVYCDYVNLPKVVNINSLIYVDDGLLSLKVTEKGSDFVICEVQNDAKLGSRKGCNLPEIDVDLPALSTKDKADIDFAVEQNVDMIFASFIRKAQDVRDVRAQLGEKGKDIKIMSKIENHEGVRNFDEVLKETDGVMVARGDLGIEVPPAKVFLAQKMMISKCNIVAKPVICATQMLDSMTYNPRPTRAEVSDVANAVLDGADCVMLSGETAKGDYPTETVTVMGEICREAEAAYFYKQVFRDLRDASLKKWNVDNKDHQTTTETIAGAVVEASNDNDNIKAIFVLSTSGTSARYISKYRPQVPIFMITHNDKTGRQGHLSRGVFPLIHDIDQGGDSFQDYVDKRLDWAQEKVKSMAMISTGDEIICVQGYRGGVGNTNNMHIITVE